MSERPPNRWGEALTDAAAVNALAHEYQIFVFGLT